MIENLLELNKRFLAEGGYQEGDKLSELISKLGSARFDIAFCGHFSAGKSSLINKLCGYPLLPSSPIPTSANIVRISNGAPSAQVISADGGVAASILLDELQEYCLIGDNIKSIQMTYPIPMLGANTSLMDTPGVDSADQAHLVSTESALHLADVVFYVMDYNHIQSEVNFLFTKQMKEWGKPLYLIVNQIDKHREQELSFDDLKQQTEKAFTEWNIHPEGIIFISIKEPNHVRDEYEKVQWLILELQKQRHKLISANVFTAVEFLIDQHCAQRVSDRESVKNNYRRQLNGDIDAAGAVLEYQKISKELQEVKQFPDLLISQLKKETASLIDNAHIMPPLT
ncbi:MAG TPA: dynamin family protein, partial [Bacilli bacterium]